MEGQAVPSRVSVDRVISQVKVLSHQLSWSVHQWFLGDSVILLSTVSSAYPYIIP